MFMGPFEQAIAWNEDSLVGPRRFIEKVWKLSTKIQEDSTIDASVLNQTVKKVTEDIEDMKFNTAISSLMILVNHIEKTETISKEEFETFLKLLAPFTPHVADELWEALGHTASIHVEPWPAFDASKLQADTVTVVIQVNGKLRASIVVPIDSKATELETIARNLPEIIKWIDTKEVKKVIVVPNKIVNIVTT
jgi:leucyl-tRNA synthetase